jgi:hypothetical protein
MKQKEARPLLAAAWDEWAARKGVDLDDATGRDTLQFYYNPPGRKITTLEICFENARKMASHSRLARERTAHRIVKRYLDGSP